MALLDTNTQLSFFVGGFGEGLDHPECIACGLDNMAFAGGEAGQIYRIEMTTGEFEEIGNTGGFVGGLAQDGNRNLYACSNGAVWRITPGGACSVYSNGTPGNPIATPNYPVFDQAGNLFVSDSGGWKDDSGRLFRIRPGGEAEVWEESLCQFPNGLAISPDGQYLYVAVSLNSPRVSRVAMKADGTSGTVETVVDMPETVPDGLTFDTEGNLYISCYRPDRIYRFSPEGELVVLADDFEGTYMAAPTNVAFCGDNREVFLSANLGRWHITRYDIEATGAALNYPKIP